jgi:hypothetical protein
MSCRRLVRIFCILALLFAQQAALTHAAWHAGEQAAGHERRHDASFQDKLCDLHGAFCQVLGALPKAAAMLPPVHRAHVLVCSATASCVVTALHTPPSRAPPFAS